MALADQCRGEIAALHAWFQDWFRAEIADTDGEFERVAGALAGDFRLVSPVGSVDTRETLLAKLRSAHGARRGQNFRIWIEDFQVRCEVGDLCVVTYEEWQEQPSATRVKTTVRLSSAVFRAQPDAPNGVEWLHLHETWRAEQPQD